MRKLPQGMVKIGEARCPSCLIKVIQHDKSPVLGFCPKCREPIRWTGSAFILRSSESGPTMSPAEDDIWRDLRRIHCSHPKKKAKQHACQGTISFTPTSMTLDCELCGFTEKKPLEKASCGHNTPSA